MHLVTEQPLNAAARDNCRRKVTDVADNFGGQSHLSKHLKLLLINVRINFISEWLPVRVFRITGHSATASVHGPRTPRMATASGVVLG